MRTSLNAVLPVVLCLTLLTACPPGPSGPQVNITGAWTGTIDDSSAGKGAIALNIVQRDDEFEGTWVSEFGAKEVNAGTLSGFLDGTNFFATFTPTDTLNCAFAATASVDTTTISGSYVAIDCSQTITGTVLLQKEGTPAEGEGEGEGESAPEIQWERSFTSTESANGIVQTGDGGYLFVGGTSTGSNIIAVKLDSRGLEVWSKIFGGSETVRPSAITNVPGGGFIIAGYMRSSLSKDDMYIIRVDDECNTLWSQTFGGKEWEQAYDVRIVPGGGFIIAGYTSSFGAGGRDMYVVRINDQGDEVWSKTFGGPNDDYALSVANAPGGGFAVAGVTESLGAVGIDIYVVRLDANGNLVWQNLFGGVGTDRANAILSLPEGGYLVAGSTASFGAGSSDMYVVKVDEQGNEVWSRTHGGTRTDNAMAITRMTEGGYAVAGSTSSFGAGKSDAYLVGINGLGNALWFTTFGGAEYEESARAIIQASDGGLVLAGQLRSQAYVVKTKP